MRKTLRVGIIPILLLLAVACASTGAGDPVVVKAEDALSNGLAVYTAAMNYHFANSTRESPEVYKIFEKFRAGFPTAWDALDKAKRDYQTNRRLGSGRVESGIAALAVLITEVKPLYGGN